MYPYFLFKNKDKKKNERIIKNNFIKPIFIKVLSILLNQKNNNIYQLWILNQPDHFRREKDD